MNAGFINFFVLLLDQQFGITRQVKLNPTLLITVSHEQLSSRGTFRSAIVLFAQLYSPEDVTQDKKQDLNK